jgi:hypothetical protein
VPAGGQGAVPTPSQQSGPPARWRHSGWACNGLVPSCSGWQYLAAAIGSCALRPRHALAAALPPPHYQKNTITLQDTSLYAWSSSQSTRKSGRIKPLDEEHRGRPQRAPGGSAERCCADRARAAKGASPGFTTALRPTLGEPLKARRGHAPRGRHCSRSGGGRHKGSRGKGGAQRHWRGASASRGACASGPCRSVRCARAGAARAVKCARWVGAGAGGAAGRSLRSARGDGAATNTWAAHQSNRLSCLEIPRAPVWGRAGSRVWWERDRRAAARGASAAPAGRPEGPRGRALALAGGRRVQLQHAASPGRRAR